MPLGHRLEGVAEGDGVVGGGDGVGVLEVDLVLAGGVLVVRGLDFDAHGFEGVGHVGADIHGEVGGQIKVTALVVGQGFDLAGLVGAEEEELELGTGVELVAHLTGLIDHALEVAAGIADEGLAVGQEDVADHAGMLLAGGDIPGDDAEGAEVGQQEHVGFGDPGEAFDARAVEPLAEVDGVLELGEGDGDALHDAEHVAELEVDERHALFAGMGQDRLLVGGIHGEHAWVL
ncbi:hypothetical protein D3C87_1027970 [compost metagenome]